MPSPVPVSADASIDASSAPLRHPLTSDLPPVVDAVLARHRAEIAEQARGRVLVVAGSVPGLVAGRGRVSSVDVSDDRLSAAAGRRDPLALPGDAAPPPGPGRVYDTVVSVGGLLTEPDLPGVLAAVDALLAPGGRLVLVDSTRSWRRGLDQLAAGLRLWPAVGRLHPHIHLHRDLVGALWAHGFIPLAVERFTVPTPVVPLRSWGHVVAARTDEVAVGVWA